MLQNLTNVTYDEIKVGDTAGISRTISIMDIELVSLFSGDIDAFHIKENGASDERPNADSTDSTGAEALLNGLLGTRLPGPGMKIIGHDRKFQGEIRVGDRLTATVTVKEKRRDSQILFDCRCVNQHGEELISGETLVTAPSSRITYAEVAPPQLALRRGDAFINLFRACEFLPPVTCAVVHPCDRDSLMGAVLAAEKHLIQPVLIGPRAKITAAAAEADLDVSAYRIVDVEHSHAAAAEAAEMARTGEVAAIMKGSLHTDELMAAVVSSSAGLRTDRRMSHVFVMDVPAYPKALFLTDAAINIAPTLDDKADIIRNAVDLAVICGIEEPKVAILAAVEIVNPKMPATIDAAALCKMRDRGQIAAGILDGPLAFDNAISAQAAKTKHISSPVAGQTDILVVPDLEAGNMLAKQLSYLAGAEGAGIVLGARVPVVLTSRADSVRSRLASTALMAVVANGCNAATKRVT